LLLVCFCTEDKKEITLELGNALRRILQINPNLAKTAKDEGKPLVQGPVVAVVSSAPSSVPSSMPKRAPLPVPSYCLVDQPPFIFNSNWGMPPPPHPGMMPPQQPHPGMMPPPQPHPGMMPPPQTHPGMMHHQHQPLPPPQHGGRQGKVQFIIIRFFKLLICHRRRRRRWRTSRVQG
jgi:hypothetical protein